MYRPKIMDDTFEHNRRSGIDRRQKGKINFRLLITGGRRKAFRRREDKQKRFFVDQYSTIHFAAVFVILILSATDALLTLFLINNGAVELNPVMDFYIQTGPYHFLTVKYALTCMGVFSLLIFRNIYLKPIKIKAGSLLFILTAVFSAVVSWQFYLIHSMLLWWNAPC